jgi:hypothetical protein
MSALLSIDPALAPALVDLVVRVAHADAMLGPSELAAVRGAEVALHVAVDAVAGPTGEYAVLASAPARERVIAYAVAVWAALADGVLDEHEAALLARVQRELRIGDAAARLSESLAFRAWADARRDRSPAYRAFDRVVVDSARHEARRRALRAA